VRTVQRWEATMGLPVHRPGGNGVVLAYPSELDDWAHRQQGNHGGSPSGGLHEGWLAGAAKDADVHRRASALRDMARQRIQALQSTARRTEALFAEFCSTAESLQKRIRAAAGHGTP